MLLTLARDAGIGWELESGGRSNSYTISTKSRHVQVEINFMCSKFSRVQNICGFNFCGSTPIPKLLENKFCAKMSGITVNNYAFEVHTVYIQIFEAHNFHGLPFSNILQKQTRNPVRHGNFIVKFCELNFCELPEMRILCISKIWMYMVYKHVHPTKEGWSTGTVPSLRLVGMRGATSP